eukprot:2811080-Lingulodinium_polyedra.AAC.1
METGEVENCPVCINRLHDGQHSTYAWPGCGHGLHLHCYHDLMTSDLEVRCPVCRMGQDGRRQILCCPRGSFHSCSRGC